MLRTATLIAALLGGATQSTVAQDADAALGQQVSQLRQQGKYAEALTVQRERVANIEKAEAAGAGNPGTKTASALGNLAWHALFARSFDEALAASERAHSLSPDTLWIEINHAHALLFLGRIAEARQLYRAHKGAPMLPASDRIWEDTVEGDFVALRAAGLEHADFDEIIRSLGIDSSVPKGQIDTLIKQVGQHYGDGRYGEAAALAEQYLQVVRRRYQEEGLPHAQAMSLLGVLYTALGRFTDAEPLHRRALVLREAVLPAGHPDIAAALHNLAALYHAQGRLDEALPLYRRALAFREAALPAGHSAIASSLDGMGLLYSDQGRLTDAEQFYKRALALREAALPANHPGIVNTLNNLAIVYQKFGRRYAEAEQFLKRALAISEAALPAGHPQIAACVNNLANLYHNQGRISDAEPLYQRALALLEKALPADHPDLGANLNNLAALHFDQQDWAKAVDYLRRSTAIIARQAERDTAGVGQAVAGSRVHNIEQRSSPFRNLVKAVYRLAGQDQSKTVDALGETFIAAQWAKTSEAAGSLAQMAARGAAGDAKLAGVVRERQDLVDDWQKRDRERSASLAEPGFIRDKPTEIANTQQLDAIDARIAAIDRQLLARFADYAALAKPTPLSIAQVQTELSAGEALILILDTKARSEDIPEETFIWVVTKTDARWVRSELGTWALEREVDALRCGLDVSLWDDEWKSQRCLGMVKSEPQRDIYGNVRTDTLPFDNARAHALYKAMFGQIEDMIRDKSLLIVPSGALTQLPFHALLTAAPAGKPSGWVPRQVGRIGAELQGIFEAATQDRPEAQTVVSVVSLTSGGPAAAAGILPKDVLLSVAGQVVTGLDQAVDTIRAQASGSKINVRLKRNGNALDIALTVGAQSIPEWVPHILDLGSARRLSWLARKHALTVLPAVASLKALRRLAKASTATRPMVGFGNPLLDGDPAQRPWEAQWAKLARDKQTCRQIPRHRLPTSVAEKRRGVQRVATHEGHADLQHLRAQMPLHDTADELCAVAKDLHLSPDDIILGARATETTLKSMNLAKYRVLHFATHGTIAGEIDGTSEPGLILTPPTEPTDLDDGYLSASEVAALKLDAEWVILSACNTAAGGARGAEALSGLARAFFYAGARALLVSHWSVDSATTVKLISLAVGAITRDAKLGRAEALRRAMLVLIDKGEMPEAHPAHWAPFIVVGEGAVAK
jgi:CHAT domain-containing protein/Tfp pilus assembly protein PilF